MLLSYDADVLPKVRMFGHVKYTEPWSHFARVIDEYILYVIKDGNMYIKEGDIGYHLKAGDFFILEPGILHEGFRKATCDYFYAHFTHNSMQRVENDEEAMELLEKKRRKTLVSYNLEAANPTDSITYVPKHFNVSEFEYISRLQKAVYEYDERTEHYRNRVSTLLHSFILDVAHNHLLKGLSLHKKAKKSDVIAEEIVRFINKNYSLSIDSKMIEEKFSVNFDYINRAVSKLTGYTTFAYLNRVRIDNAKQLIKTTDLQFSEIADMVGIEDRYYFSKLFKKMTGMTSTEYYEKEREYSDE